MKQSVYWKGANWEAIQFVLIIEPLPRVRAVQLILRKHTSQTLVPIQPSQFRSCRYQQSKF
jgi:hypothetical protein